MLIVLRKFAWNPLLSKLQQREQPIQKDLYAANEARSAVAELQIKQNQLIEAAHIQR